MSYNSSTLDQYKDLQSSLEKLQHDVSSDLEKIRSEKMQIQSIKEEIENLVSDYYYLRDDNKIIISAPEIIIGNVGRDGTLMSTGSKITLRAENINIEGVGSDSISSGSVTTRAASIRNIAVDPGIDGLEEVVKQQSSIVNYAKSIALRSEDAKDMFVYSPDEYGIGVDISSETVINIESLVSCESSTKYVKDRISRLKSDKSSLTSDCNSLKSEISDLLGSMNDVVTYGITPITISPITTLIENQDLVMAQEEFDTYSKVLHETMGVYFEKLAQLAEVNRQITSLNDVSSDLSSLKSKIKTKDVNTQIYINSEFIGLSSVDGDGNIRETPSSSVSINAKSVSVTTQDKDQKQIVDSSINMLSQSVEISTANPKITDSNSEFPAEGDVKIVSKNIVLESVDYKETNNKIEESLLTKNGLISMRAANIKGDTTSTDGSNDGMLTLNAKRVEVKSMEVDKESRKDKNMTKGGLMLLNSEKMYVGGSGAAAESDNSTMLQLVSAEMGLFGSKTLELQQDKAVVQLASGKLSVSGSATAIYGKTTMEDDVTFSGKATGGSAKFKSVDVSTVFKGPSISDGIGAAPAGGGGSLTAKLKQDEIAAAPLPKTDE